MSARVYENVRMPNKVLATPGSSQPCSADQSEWLCDGLRQHGGWSDPTCITAPARSVRASRVRRSRPGTPGAGLNSKGQIIFTVAGNAGNLHRSGRVDLRAGQVSVRYEALKEDDYQYNIGMKFNVLGWDVDADVGYGKDIDNIYTRNSRNRRCSSTRTPRRPISMTAPSPPASSPARSMRRISSMSAWPRRLTVAIGVEAREDLYAIAAGDPLSQYKEGAQSFPGFLTADAGVHSRKNYAGYIDLALAPIEALQLDVAGRAEHYTDFGDTQIGKITARYDFSPQIGIRGTIVDRLPRSDHRGRILYRRPTCRRPPPRSSCPPTRRPPRSWVLSNLKPEISTSYSVGIVAHPLEDLSVTVDAYSIHRGQPHRAVLDSVEVGPPARSPRRWSSPAIAGARSCTIDPTVTQVGVTSFLNGLNTPDPGRRPDRQLSDRFRRYGPGRLDPGGQLQHHSGLQRGADAGAVFGGSGVTFFTAEHPVQLRAQRAGGEDRPHRQLVAGRVRRSPSAKPIGARRRISPAPTGCPRSLLPRRRKRVWA